jgi:hypothetical protein
MMPMKRYERDQIGIRSWRAITPAAVLRVPAPERMDELSASDAMKYSFHTSASMERSSNTVGNTHHAGCTIEDMFS